MKIEYDLIRQQDLEEFADEFGLVLVVHENTLADRIERNLRRYSAYFKDLQLVDKLSNLSGSADTIDDAIELYAGKISLKKAYIESADKYINIPNLRYIIYMVENMAVNTFLLEIKIGKNTEYQIFKTEYGHQAVDLAWEMHPKAKSIKIVWTNNIFVPYTVYEKFE
jgi:hypothetical protein